MTRLNRMMLMANGQMPAPNSSCDLTASNPNSAGHTVLTKMARVMNAVDVVIRAMKHPQNRTLSAFEFIVIGSSSFDRRRMFAQRRCKLRGERPIDLAKFSG